MRKVEKNQQLMSRFEALMDEQSFSEAEDVARIVEETTPNEVTPRAATLWARTSQYHRDMQIVRAERHRNFFTALFQVERSHVPFPDEPPIVYPPAEVWRELTNRRREKYSSVDLKGQSGIERKIKKALDRTTTLEYIDTPLNDVINSLQEDLGINIRLDTTAIDEAGIQTDTPVTVNLTGITLRSGLRLMLGDLELTYIIKDEVLLITTTDEAENELTVKVYPVADLVLPIQQLGGGGLGGLGGGLGGGGGFGGGGGGGGGFGGGGGGFGGGGGGQGQFMVPEANATESKTEAATKTSEQSVLLLNKEAKKVAPKTTAKETSKKIATKKKTKTIGIDMTADPDQVWNRYLSKRNEDPSVVKQTVADFMKSGNTKHAIALMKAALRNGQPQPWMYEALGLAMELDGQSKENIERTLMSAVEFASSPTELLYIAQYMSHRGLNARALQLSKQVVRLQPLEYKAYLLGLHAAKQENNLDGVRWATVGLLSQAWPKEQAEVKKVAFRAAGAALADLKKAGRTEEYLAFQKELDEAMIRDCVIQVRWTGEADIDLIVEEPGGTICSLRNRRTASGGVNLGDSFAKYSEEKEGGFYRNVCLP